MMLFIARLYFVRLSEKPPLVPISSNNRRSTAITKCELDRPRHLILLSFSNINGVKSKNLNSMYRSFS